jgi:large subunit ribosomal protein L4
VVTIEIREAVGGEVIGQRELPEELFAAPINVPLMHQIVVAGAAGHRAGTHATKGRGDVRGGGVKPWRQKGTGRARQGSIRAPHWTGGGVAHGPHPRGHAMRVNRKMKRGALRAALSDAFSSGKLAVVETLAFAEPRTKDAVRVLAALGLEGKVLVVLSRPNAVTEKSFRNLANVRIDFPGNLTTYDLLYADRVLFTQAALGVLTGDDPEAAESVVELPELPAGRGSASETAVMAEAEPVPEPEGEGEATDEAGETDGETDGEGEGEGEDA